MKLSVTAVQAGSAASIACIVDDHLEQLFVVSRQPRQLDAGWLAGIFSESPLTAESRQSLVRGLPAEINCRAACGETICACHGTTRGEIVDAAIDGGLLTPSAIGAATRAGTNCGSCVPEIGQIIDES